ncbi:MAG: lipid asymmetry maintenance protein MlaB [Gammaproteobacteria bacterium]
MDTPPSSGGALCLPSSLRIADVAEFRALCDPLLASDGPLAVDAAEVEYIDAAGLQLLVALSRACATQGRPFTLAAPSAALSAAARVAGFAPLLGLAAN